MIWTRLSAIVIILCVVSVLATCGSASTAPAGKSMPGLMKKCRSPYESHSVAHSSLPLIIDGQPASIIVVADRPTRAASLGATELQSWLLKMTGAAVPILPESQVPMDTAETLILVGDMSMTAELGLFSGSFELEEFRICTFPGVLVLMGDDERPDGMRLYGTFWAVETFAEEFLGIRYLWPGPLGEVVPRYSTIEVGNIDVRKVPQLRQRRIRNLGYSPRVQIGLDKLGWDAEEFKQHHVEAAPWFWFHRIGGSLQGRYGHAFQDYWERFHEDHPDWFALQPDGTRDNSRAGSRARLCVSNMELIEQVVRDTITTMEKCPTWDTVSISPNDGGYATFCLCESCEAWDDPDGEMIEIQTPDGPMPHVSLTDRYVRFYSTVAEVVARYYPDRYLGAYAYSAYALPPVRAKLHPNIAIGFVGFGYLNEYWRQKARESWLKWSEKAQKLFLRPSALMAGMGFPTVYVHRLAEDLSFCDQHGMFFTDFDACFQHWATDGLNYYVLAKLLWDPCADVEAIMDDYCRAGFGPAADFVKRYFRHLEEITTDLALSNAYRGRKENPEVLAQCYTDEFLAECHKLLDKAEHRARSDEVILQRIAFLRKGLEYTRIRRDWTIAWFLARQGDSEAAEKLKLLIAERDAWYQDLGISWALNAPYLRFYGY